MTYQVLARRLRPATFDALVGQEHVVRALVNALDGARLHHAYLFTGTRGVGKTTIARIFAKCLNCETGVTSKPCGKCSACIEIAEGRFVDLIEVDAASRTKVDDTRELLDNVQYRPTRGRFKVYLIDEVHMLSAASFNALLKTLEEPPEHVKFLLATTDPKKVPVTVLSRCLQFQLRNLLPEKIRGYLAEILRADKVPYDDAALVQIARAAQGSMRDALSITDQAIAYGAGRVVSSEVAAMLGTVGLHELEPLVAALVKGDGAALLEACAMLATQGADFAAALASLLDLLHDAAVAHTLGGQGDESSAVVALLTESLTAEAVQLHYQIALMGLRDLSLAPDPRCGFEMTMLRMLAFDPHEAALPPTEGSARTTGRADAREPAAPTPKAPRKKSSGPTSAADSVSMPVAAPTSTDGQDWYELVPTLGLAGVTRMIVEHAYPQAREGNRWVLCLDRSHDTLLNDAQVRHVARAVSTRLGFEVHVEIVPGTPSAETPAARNARVLKERHAAAVESLTSDTHVRSLLEAFDGRLDLESVRPLPMRRSS